MTRSTRSRGIARTTAAIEASSFKVGITTVTRGCAWCALCPSWSRRASMCSQAPAQPAAGAGCGRVVGHEVFAKRAIARTIPDVLQGLLGGVAQRIVLIAALGERRDAARERAAVGGEIHHRPRAPAHRPWRRTGLSLEAEPRLRYRAGGAERHSVAARERGGLLQLCGVLAGHLLIERLIAPGMPDRVLLEKHQALQIHFLHADFRRDPHECRQFADRFLEPGQPGRHARTILAFAVLQLAKRPHVSQNSVEVVLAAH